jgi:hypothetical protein
VIECLDHVVLLPSSEGHYSNGRACLLGAPDSLNQRN